MPHRERVRAHLDALRRRRRAIRAGEAATGVRDYAARRAYNEALSRSTADRAVHLERIHPRLYLSGRGLAQPSRAQPTVCVAGAATTCGYCTAQEQKKGTCAVVDARDTLEQDESAVRDFANEGADAIARALERTKRTKRPVLVHCAMGVNRSVSAIVAFATRSGWAPADAIAYVRERNDTVRGLPALTNRLFERVLLATPPTPPPPTR